MSTKESGDVAVAERQDVKEPSKYNVIAHNNDFTSYDEVVYVISRAFEVTEGAAFEIARKIDSEGQGVCGTYSKEIATTKLNLVEMIKKSLIALIPGRAREIDLLKFTMEAE